MGGKIDVLHRVLTWLCEFVGYMMNRMEVASDGKTPYERVKGKRSEVMGLEFCEKVLWKYHPGKRVAKFDARWGYGLFLGVRSRSGELIVVDGESREVKYVRTVKRIPEEQRWDPNNLEWITMVPWNRGSGDKEADGELPEFDRGGEAGHHEGRDTADYPQSAPSESRLRQTWLHGQVPGVFGDLERTTYTTQQSVETGWRQLYPQTSGRRTRRPGCRKGRRR